MKKDALNISRPFDWHLIPVHDAVKDFVDDIWAEIYPKKTAGEERVAIQKTQLACVLLDLFRSHETHPDVYIGIRKSPELWKEIPERYNPLGMGGETLRGIIDRLHSLNYIEHHKGFKSQTGYSQGRLTRIKARPNLVQRFVNAGLTLAMIGRHLDEETIELRGEKPKKNVPGKQLTYDDDPNTIDMRAHLAHINERIANRVIEIKLSDREFEELRARLRQDDREPLDFSRRKLKRIFNDGSFQCGGRFYGGWWQNLPKEYRSRITIDLWPTVELDYSGLHMAFLYSREGVNEMLDGDPYELEGLEQYRSFVKRCMQVILNSKDKPQALGAMQDTARQINQAGKDTVPLEKEFLAETLHRLKEKHAAVAEYFHSGMGIEFQYLDSRIAEDVMLRLWEVSCCALPVHDSFIVPYDRENELREQMKASYAKIMKRPPPRMDVKCSPKGEGHEYDSEHDARIQEWIDKDPNNYARWQMNKLEILAEYLSVNEHADKQTPLRDPSATK